MAAPTDADVMAKYQEIFSLVDDDDNNSITTEELAQILRANGNDVDDAAVNAIIAKVDDDGDGSIDVEEFKTLLEDSSVKDAAKLAVVFLSLDTDGDRTVSSDELTGAQGVIPDDKLTALKTSADSNSKKELTFREFLEVMASK